VLRKGDSHPPPALSDRSLATAPADEAERMGSLTQAEEIPPDVAELAAVWHRLPNAIRAGTVAMVRASGG